MFIFLCVVQCRHTEKPASVSPLRSKTTGDGKKNGQERDEKLQEYIRLLNCLDLQSPSPTPKNDFLRKASEDNKDKAYRI